MFVHIGKKPYLCSRKIKRNKQNNNQKTSEQWKRNKTKQSTNKLVKVAICSQYATLEKVV